jgi:hypothetical protein
MSKEPRGRRSHPIDETRKRLAWTFIYKTLIDLYDQIKCNWIFPLLAAFEAFYDGSWHGVKCIRVRDGGLFVKFIYSGSTVEHNVCGGHLRMRSRRATCFDCSHVLKPGVDVAVQSPDALQVSSTGENISCMLGLHSCYVIFYRCEKKLIIFL